MAQVARLSSDGACIEREAGPPIKKEEEELVAQVARRPFFGKIFKTNGVLFNIVFFSS